MLHRAEVRRLLDFIVEEFPSPLDRGAITVIGKGGEEKERPCEPAGDEPR